MVFKATKCITAGFNEKNESDIVNTRKAEAIIPYEIFPSFQLQNLFYTEDSLQSLTTHHSATPYNIDLPPQAIRFLKIRMPTKDEIIADMESAEMEIPKDWSKYNLHCTDSVDYIYILSGSVTCFIGEKNILLKEGDFLTQVGAEHTWLNEGDKPCFMLCTMVGIEPTGKRAKMDVES